MKLGFSIQAFVTLIFMAVSVTLGCNSDIGPAGLTQCYLETPHYSNYQCGTCLTDAYIRQRSDGKHGCRDNKATYCYYPCMLEKYGLDKGPVYDDCLCNTSRELQHQSLLLPAACYQPTGMGCEWYRHCLAKMFNCTGPAEYAISYGEKYCSLYEQSKSQLSQKGLQWLDAARKCLQVVLVPTLHLCQAKPVCEDIKTKAFDSHVQCYVEPYEGHSVCSLSVGDWMNIVATVKSSFVSSAWFETVKATLLTAGKCVGIWVWNWI